MKTNLEKTFKSYNWRGKYTLTLAEKDDSVYIYATEGYINIEPLSSNTCRITIKKG